MFSGVLTFKELYIGKRLFAKLNATKQVDTDFIIVKILAVGEENMTS